MREKTERLGKWHRHFAWLPVRVGLHEHRWLEFVERRKMVYSPLFPEEWAAFTPVEWEYRPLS